MSQNNLTPSTIIRQQNQSKKRCAIQQISQTQTKFKFTPEKNDQQPYIQQGQLVKKIISEQGNYPYHYLKISSNMESVNLNKTSYNHETSDLQQNKQFQNNKQQILRQKSLESSKFTLLGLEVDKKNKRDISNGRQNNIETKITSVTNQKSLNNQNIFLVKQVNGLRNQKNTQINQEKHSDNIIGFKREASVPQNKCNNSIEKSSFTKIASIIQQSQNENYLNNFPFTQKNRNKKSCQLFCEIKNNLNNQMGNIFNYQNCTRQNFFTINQKKNDIIKMKFLQTQQQNTQKHIHSRQSIEKQYQNFLQPNNNKDFEYNLKSKNQNDIQKNSIQQQNKIKQNKQILLSNQGNQYQHQKKFEQNDKKQSEQSYIIQEQKKQIQKQPNNEIKQLLNFKKNEDMQNKYEKLNYLKRQCSYQKLIYKKNETIVQTTQRNKFLNRKNFVRENLKSLKPAKVQDAGVAKLTSESFTKEEQSKKLINARILTSISSQQQSPCKRSINSSNQSFDEIKIWGSSQNSRYSSFDSINSNKQSKQILNQEDFLKLYCKRYKNYPEIGQCDKKMNDEEIQTLVQRLFFKNNKRIQNSSFQNLMKTPKKQYIKSKSTPKMKPIQITKTTFNTPKVLKKKYLENESNNTIAYEVAMMSVNSPNLVRTAALTSDSTPILHKFHTTFKSDSKSNVEQFHQEFIKCFFQKKNIIK